MSFMLDTCVVSELRKTLPDAGVVEWFKSVPDELIFLSGVVLGELRCGIDRLPAGKKRSALHVWYEEVQQSFARQTVGCSPRVFARWGELRAREEAMGRSLPVIDGLIAASAIDGDFVLVTRNIADFANLGVQLLNPWQQ